MQVTPLKSAALALLLAVAPVHAASAQDDGVVRVKSAYSVEETVERLKQTIASKGITFFADIDQGRLAADAGIELRPSRLLLFGNPALGTTFITARAQAGLDWPVRLLVSQDADGQVWTAYNDFGWIARRHGIDNRGAQFDMATQVIGSITSSVSTR